MPKSTTKTGPVSFRVPVDARHLIRAAAAREGVTPSDWLRAAAEHRLSEDLGLTVDLTAHRVAEREFDGD